MWCTRWFLPLLLLPLPTAPPYFLILFLFSLTMHAKPCFYCIVLLTTLFVSSCYWQPFPIDSPLSIPWSDNITTFSEALNSTLMPNHSYVLPTVMRAVDRCWCDFSTGGFWEPFNVSQWEYLSVQRLRRELERQHKDANAIPGANNTQSPISANDSISVPLNQTLLPLSNSTVPASNFWSRLRDFPRGSQRVPTAETRETDPPLVVGVQSIMNVPQAMNQSNLPFIRQEYDLRPYGIGLVVDLGWSR
ncbi:hypothetical protein BYT27DRAFT_7223452 [Phlegmacium glaucopus]|nr:hypothetical protein BYT27DRAFT_7223452 [Phlegmacium glaucopus]